MPAAPTLPIQYPHRPQPTPRPTPPHLYGWHRRMGAASGSRTAGRGRALLATCVLVCSMYRSGGGVALPLDGNLH